tara:strand:- start:1886 stop:2104 length:219 start_codon:yes stop_codon:yes gene_type:complete
MEDKKRFQQNQIFNTKYLIRDVFDLPTLKELHEDIQDAILSKDEYAETEVKKAKAIHTRILNELYLEEIKND